MRRKRSATKNPLTLNDIYNSVRMRCAESESRTARFCHFGVFRLRDWPLSKSVFTWLHTRRPKKVVCCDRLLEFVNKARLDDASSADLRRSFLVMYS